MSIFSGSIFPPTHMSWSFPPNCSSKRTEILTKLKRETSHHKDALNFPQHKWNCQPLELICTKSGWQMKSKQGQKKKNITNITLQSVDSLHKIRIEHRHKHMHNSNPRLHQRTTFRNKMQSADSSEGLSSLGMKCLNNSTSSDASSLLSYPFITILWYKHLLLLQFLFAFL